MSEHQHPTRDDPVVRGLSESVGGPMGDHGGGHRWWTPTRVVLLLTAICFALGMVQKAPCLSGEPPADPNYRYSHMCYSDLPPLYTYRGFVEVEWPYTDDEQVRERFQTMEYPVGISYWAWATAQLTHWLSGSPDTEERRENPLSEVASRQEVRDEARLWTVINAASLAAVALLAAWLLAGVHRRRPWDAAIFAAAPTLALTGLINWDLLAVVFVAGALWAWERERVVLVGLCIGLGTAVKLYPLFLLGALLIICIRRKRLADFTTLTGVAILSWGLANLPALLTSRDQWKVFWTFNSDRGPDLGSIWLVITQASGEEILPATVNGWSWLIFGLWCVVVLALGLLAPETPRFAQLGFLVVVGFLLINKVYSPQYVLWLLPLAALARPRWRDQIVWQSTEIFYFACVWWYLGSYLAPGAGGDAGFYWVAIVVRMLGELYLAGFVVRDMFSPRHDPVKEPGVVDDVGSARWWRRERQPLSVA